MDITIIINLILVAILIALTAYFVGCEFAVVKIRMSRIDQLVAEGNKKAVAIKKVITNLDYYLSACQLGITVTALGLGTLGKPTVERMLSPLFTDFGASSAVSAIVSYSLALSITTFLHVVIGELAPKTLAIQFAEEMTLLLGPSLVIFGKIMFPFIWFLNGSARTLLRLFGVKPIGHEQAPSEEELKIIINHSFQSGEINQTELSYLENILTFDQLAAKDKMVPRTQVVFIDQSMTKEEVLHIIDENHFTRYPVTKGGDKDSIIGVINAKELVTNYALGRGTSMKEQLHAIPFIHETTRLQDVLLKMQKEHIHIAVVIDEYGGTAGIITMEDLLEEIVGEIRDEFDEDEIADIIRKSDEEYLINGRVLLNKLEDQFKLSFENNYSVDTIGGWIQVQYMFADDVPKVIEHGAHKWEIVKMDNHQVLQVSLHLNAFDDRIDHNAI